MKIFATDGAGVAVEGSVIKNSVIDKNVEIAESMLTGSLIGKKAYMRASFGKLNIGADSVASNPALPSPAFAPCALVLFSYSFSPC